MSPIFKGLAGVAIVLVLPASAQGVLSQKNISLALAQCQSMDFKVAVTVLDRGGHALVMLRDDSADLHTSEGSDRKAFTARTFSRPSSEFVKRMLDDPAAVGSRSDTRVLALGGGLPIKVGTDVIGAVGVSGSPGKDDVCSQAGIDRVADLLK